MSSNGSEDRRWSISTVNIMTALGTTKPHHLVATSDLLYTVLNGSIVYHNAQELATLHSCDPTKPVSSYIAFKPKRLALHEVIVAIVTTVQYDTEEIMQALVKQIHAEIVLDINSLNLDALRVEITEQIESLLDNPIQLESIENQDVKAIVRSLDATDETKLQRFIQVYTKRDAIITLATDLRFSKAASLLLKDKVEIAIQNKGYPRIEIPPQNKRKTLLVTGGISSGKGSSVSLMKLAAEKNGISWPNVVKVNGDSLKPLILDPGNPSIKPELYSQLAQEEAAILTKVKIKGALRQQVANASAPHMFFDQTRIEGDALLGVENEGGVIGIVVATDLETAMDRSIKRGDETRRYEASLNIVNNHKAVADELVRAISELKGKPAEFTLIDNNSSQLVEIATVKTAEKTVDIHEPEKLKNFSRKCSINTDASGPSDVLYTSDGSDNYFRPLLLGIDPFTIKRDEVRPDNQLDANEDTTYTP
jgi:hypothetical protein